MTAQTLGARGDGAAATASSTAAEPHRVPWALPRRTGPYLTGTAGGKRLVGVDAARGLALVGMIAAHVGMTTCGLTSVPGLLSQAHRRAAALFAVIAGMSLGIMSGRTEPHSGDRLVRTRLRLPARSAMLLVLGAALVVLDSPVSVILGYYAAWLALAIPFLRWRPRRLLVLAAATAVLGPVIGAVLPWALGVAGMAPTR